MRHSARPTTILGVLAFLLLAAMPAIAQSPRGPDVVVHGSDTWTPVMELALDEVAMLWRGERRKDATPPVLVDGATVIRVTRDAAAIQLEGASTTVELIAQAGALRIANPGWETRLVVYTPGEKRSPHTRRLLTEEIVVVSDSGIVTHEHATDPLRTLELMETIARRGDVRSVEAVASASDYLQARLARKMARLKRQDQPNERQEFFAKKRLAPGERHLPTERYFQARQHMRQMPLSSTAGGGIQHPSVGALGMSFDTAAAFLGSWTPLGPGNVGGRTRGLVIDPGTPNTMYAAGVAGGVWKTTDGGASWVALTDTILPNLAVASLDMDPTNSSVLYAGTGEGFFNFDAVRGAGIFKTTDAGASWNQLASTATINFFFVNKVKVLGNGTTVLAATSTGLWRSTNAGSTWTQIIPATGVNGCFDIAAGSTYVLASCGTFAQGTVHRSNSADASVAFTPVLGSAGTTDFAMGRTTLAIAPSDNNVAYALASSIAAGNYNLGLRAVYRSSDGGLTWTPQVTNTLPPSPSFLQKQNTLLLTNPVFANLVECGFDFVNFFFNQGWYDNVIAVDPVNENIVWTGGIDLFRSADGGANWAPASFWWRNPTESAYVHADQHAIVFHPGYNGTTNQTMFVGNDGGVFKTTNARASASLSVCGPNQTLSWTNLNNGYGITQFYHGLPYPGSNGGDTFFGGTQDNGTVRGTAAGGINAWQSLLGGDGGYVAVDATNSTIVYAENTGLSIQKSTTPGNATNTFFDATVGITENPGNFMFITPFTMSPNNSNILWIGGLQMWRTTNGAANWSAASSSFGAGCGSVSAIAVAPGNDNLVLAGTELGCVKRVTNAQSSSGATVWADVSSALPNAYVSWIGFDPNDANTVYVTFSTFNVGHVWKSIDGGVTWSNVDGAGGTALPNVPVHTIIVAPGMSSKLYVGTDVGVFASDDGGASWSVENTGFANVITESLAIGQVGGVPHLFAFTHGRGVFRVQLPAALADVATTVAAVAANTSVVPGGSVNVTNTARNVGGQTTPVFTVGFALVPVDGAGNPNGSDIPLGATRAAGPLAGNASSNAVTPVLIGASTVAGTYKIKVTADTLGVVTDDTNQTNNSLLTNSFVVSIPDLTVPSVTFTPAILGVGANVSVTHTISNLAPAPANAPASLSAIYLATNNSFSTVLLPAIGTVTAPAVNAGATSAPIVKSVAVPAATPPGRYFVIVNANDNNVFTEVSTTNNWRSSTTMLTVGPDLLVTAATSTPAIVAPGGNVAVASTVKNQAAATATSFGVSFALVPISDTSGGSDIPLAVTRTVGGLGAGLMSTATTNVTVPALTAPGQYRIRVIVDPANLVAEANEANNTFLIASVITVLLPDLIVTSVTAPAAVTTGTAFAAGNTVKNNSGVTAPGPFGVSFFLSTDTTLGGGDIPLGATRTVSPSLGANLTSVATTMLTIPNGTPVGIYRVLVQADSANVVVEGNESNNTGFSAPVIVGPDLVVTTATATPAIVVVGGNVAVNNTVKNLGATSTGAPFGVSYFLSTDATFNPGTDIPLGATRTVTPALAGGAVSTATSNVTIPAGTVPGSYRILVVADVAGVIGEANENNNVFATAPFAVSLSDLTVTTVTAPAAVSTGTPFAAGNTVKNNSGVTAPGPFAVSFFLSTDTTLGGGDIPLGATRTVTTLAANGVSTASTMLTIPNGTPVGVYRVLVQADSANVVVEGNESNNTGFSAPVVVGPDLVVTAATATPAIVAPGGNVAVASTVKNQGVTSTGAPFGVSYFLSTDATFDPGTDIPLGATRTVTPALAGGAVSTATSNVTIPFGTASGSYRIIVVADVAGDIAEASESNNVRATGAFTVTRPDLIVTTVTAPAAVTPGTPFAVGNTVKNDSGVSAPGPFSVAFFLSTDTIFDGSDIPLGASRTVTPALGPNLTSAASTMLTVPIGTAPGVYRVIVVADATDAVLEDLADENNNTGASGSILVGPDLSMTVFTVPATAIAGRALSLANTVKNNGAAASGPFQVGLYFSQDGNTIDTGVDTLLGSRSVTNLTGGMLSAVAVPISVPSVMGSFFLGAVADHLNAVIEASEVNNVTVAPINIVPDLVRTNVTAQLTFNISSGATCGGVISGGGVASETITAQTGGAFSGGRLTFSDTGGPLGPGNDTITFSGTVNSAGAVTGTFALSRVGGGGGSGSGTLSGTAAVGNPGALTLNLTGTFTAAGFGTCGLTATITFP